MLSSSGFAYTATSAVPYVCWFEIREPLKDEDASDHLVVVLGRVLVVTLQVRTPVVQRDKEEKTDTTEDVVYTGEYTSCRSCSIITLHLTQ